LDNKLLVASYSLEETEYKLLLALLGEVNPRLVEKEQTHGGVVLAQDGDILDCTKLYTISVKDFAELYDKEIDDSRKLLKQAALVLFHKQITFKEPELGKTSYIHWVQKVVFDDINDTIGVMWTYDVTKYLCQLTQRFTKLKLGEVAKVKGAYAIRLYELLQSRWLEQGCKQAISFELEELYFCMAVPTSRQEYAEFKRRILAPGLAELERKKVGGWRLERERKVGRKVVELGFVRKKG
jgi:plasmid replication initiation protein